MTTEAFVVMLTDASGHETRVPIKSGRPGKLPRLVLWGGQVFHLEHSKLEEGPDFQADQVAVARTWIGFYREHPVFSVEFERDLPVLHDPDEAHEMIAEAVTAALELAHVCTNCGRHVSGCDAQSLKRHATPCCESCRHERYERCGAVSKSERGVPDGYDCRKPKGHADGWHQSGGAMWPDHPRPHAGSPELAESPTEKPQAPSRICPCCGYSDGRENNPDGSWKCWRCGETGGE
jgi:hypothetical protein